MPTILGAIAGFFTSLLESSVARFIALKVVLSFLFITVLPLILKKVIIWFINSTVSVITGILPSSVQSFTLQLTGLAGFMANHLHIPDAFSIIVSAYIFRLSFSIIKTIF